MNCERILIAGAGGQGIVFLGKLIAKAALETVPHVTYFPSYGAEVRGGSSHCQVILSGKEIPSPVAHRFEIMLILNEESFTRFLPQLLRNGLAVINSSLCSAEPARNRLLVPATQTADEIGDPRVANLVLLGVLLSRRPLVAPARIERALRAALGENKATLERNLAAFHAGLALE
jgi:2-oxoglutarate ferredoxin oxidoreductase subunit gamma